MAEDKSTHLQNERVDSRSRQDHLCAEAATSRTLLTAGDIMNRDVITVRPDDSIVFAAEAMTGKSITCLCVLDDGNLAGIVTEADILKMAAVDAGDTRVMKVGDIMSSPIRCVPADISVIETGQIMEAERIGRLVVVDDGCPVGTITQTDIIRTVTAYTMSKDVSEIMTTDVAALPGSASVSEAAELMVARSISCVVVTDEEAVAGVLTKRDVLRRVVALGRDPAKTCVRDVMSFPVVTMPSYYSIASADKLLEQKGISRLVVVDHNVLRGVVAQTDVLRAIESRVQHGKEEYLTLLGQLTAYSHSIWLSENLKSILRS